MVFSLYFSTRYFGQNIDLKIILNSSSNSWDEFLFLFWPEWHLSRCRGHNGFMQKHTWNRNQMFTHKSFCKLWATTSPQSPILFAKFNVPNLFSFLTKLSNVDHLQFICFIQNSDTSLWLIRFSPTPRKVQTIFENGWFLFHSPLESTCLLFKYDLGFKRPSFIILKFLITSHWPIINYFIFYQI